VAIFLNGEALATRGARGERILDDTFLLLVNAHHESLAFAVPSVRWGAGWRLVLNTATTEGFVPRRGTTFPSPGEQVIAPARSLVLLQREPGPGNGGVLI
jgi:glycogen operon protein